MSNQAKDQARSVLNGLFDIAGINRGDALADKLAACTPGAVNVAILAVRSLKDAAGIPSEIGAVLTDLIADGEVGDVMREALPKLADYAQS